MNERCLNQFASFITYLFERFLANRKLKKGSVAVSHFLETKGMVFL